ALVAATPIATLNATVVHVSNDRDASGTLTPGDQVIFKVGGSETTTALTFGQAVNPASGDVGSAFQTIQAAISFAAAGDTVKVARGTYAEAVTVNKLLTLDGPSQLALDSAQLPDTVINPPAGDGITAPPAGVTLR